MSNIKIISDFNDFYDELSSNEAVLKYNRMLKECKQRGTALKYLRSLNIQTVETKQVSQFYNDDELLVVYTDPFGHNGEGKRIMSVAEAKQSYSNCVASKYYVSDGLSIKYLQIGKIKINLCYKKTIPVSLNMGTLVDLTIDNGDYNRLIGIPIFSIDYISVNNKMLATDFNEVENLGRLGIQSYLTKEQIVNEITNSLLTYNKI